MDAYDSCLIIKGKMTVTIGHLNRDKEMISTHRHRIEMKRESDNNNERSLQAEYIKESVFITITVEYRTQSRTLCSSNVLGFIAFTNSFKILEYWIEFCLK
jgi:hypothetical protein